MNTIRLNRPIRLNRSPFAIGDREWFSGQLQDKVVPTGVTDGRPIVNLTIGRWNKLDQSYPGEIARTNSLFWGHSLFRKIQNVSLRSANQILRKCHDRRLVPNLCPWD
jgi:hypothetical protein